MSFRHLQRHPYNTPIGESLLLHYPQRDHPSAEALGVRFRCHNGPIWVKPQVRVLVLLSIYCHLYVIYTASIRLEGKLQ